MKISKLFFYLTMVSLLILSGCNGGSDNQTNEVNSTGSTANETPDQNLSGALIIESSRGVVDDTALVRANSALNSDLYLGLNKEGENLFYSPFSIFSALSMTYAGAKEQTKSEFETVLHYDENLSVHESFSMLLQKSSYEHNIFNIANSIWPQDGYPFKEDFIYTIYNGYASEVNFKDYINDAENARLDINEWVEQKTQEKIVDLIPNGALDATTRLVLVNALYFKGTWEYEFNKTITDKQPFYLSDASEKEVDMMHMEGDLNYYESSSYKVVELSYKENEFSMLVFLPHTQADMPLLQETLFETYSPVQFKASMYSQKVILSLPKFKIKWGTESLKELLKSLGMVESFDGFLADFTDMWHRQGDENLYVSDVVHQAFIEVNEEGAEAAAATAVIIAETASSGTSRPPNIFNADHPFIFFIIDNKTDMILFSGKVEVPKT